MSIILLLFAAVVLYLLSKVYSLFRIQRMSNTKGLGFLGILKGRRSMFDELSEIWQKEDVKPDLLHFWGGPRFGIAVAHPEAAKFLLKSNDFIKQLRDSSSYLREHFGTHLVSVNGEDWKRHRTFVNSGFSTKAYNEYYPTFSLMTEKTLSKMDIEAKNGDIEIRTWFSKFTVDLLGNSIFHHDFGRLDDKSTESYNSYTKIFTEAGSYLGRLISLFPWIESLPIPRVKRLHEAVDNVESLFHQIIKERHNGQKFDDILDNLLKSQTDEGTVHLSQTELISNLWIFFLAGHETTASALTSECICLAKYPDIQEKIYQEIQNTIGNKNPTLDDLAKLTYLDCFIHETLRLFPPVQFLPSRTASRDVQYKDHVIPKDSIIGLFIDAIHKHPDFWPEPEKFDPDRFSPENKKGRHHYAYLPFSLGPRQCIGNTFSLIEQRLFLTRLLQKYRVLPPKNSPLHYKPVKFGSVEPINMYLEQR